MPIRLSKKEPDTQAVLHFPLGGIDLSMAFDRQPTRKIRDGVYARTAPVAHNVRAFDAGQGRARGGQRPAAKPYIEEQVDGEALIQGVNSIVGMGYTAPGGGMQTSMSGRLVTLVAVSNGNVRVIDPGAENWVTPTNGDGALVSSGLVYSAPNILKLWFADGTNWKYYDPSDNTVHAWVASAGELPVDDDGNAPRLITTWRGRTVLSGLIGDPHNVFYSKVGDPTDFDYSPLSPSAVQAVNLSASPLGVVGDVVTALIPFNDDLLILLCDHEIWVMAGDPKDGGRLLKITGSIGGAWGMPWCMDAQGVIYFVSNLPAIYRWDPRGGGPVRVSQQIEQLLRPVNTGANTITMVWDDRFQGLHTFVTMTGGPFQATHLFYEARTGSWFTDRFRDKNLNPLCCTTFDGNSPQDRVALFGSWDGRVRCFDPDETLDDGLEPIDSEVVIGPIMLDDMNELLIREIQPIMGEGSGEMTYEVYMGSTAEKALASQPRLTGTMRAGRNLTFPVNLSGYAGYIKIKSSEPWAMEAIRVSVSGTGPGRRRGV